MFGKITRADAVELEEIIVEGSACYYTKNCNITKVDLIDRINNSKSISCEIPPFSCMYQAGSYIFIREFGDKFKKEDVNFDNLRPWNSSTIRTKVEKESYDGVRYTSYRGKHPRIEGLQRLILVSPSKTAICYMFKANIDISAVLKFDQRTKPSVVAHVKDTLQYRTVRNANTLLEQENIQLNNNTVHNATIKAVNCVKSATGPIPITSLDKLAEYLYPLNGYMQVETICEKPSIVAIVIFEDSLRKYGQDCPTVEELVHFKEDMKRKIHLNEIPDNYNASQFLKGCEAQL